MLDYVPRRAFPGRYAVSVQDAQSVLRTIKILLRKILIDHFSHSRFLEQSMKNYKLDQLINIISTDYWPDLFNLL